MRRIIAELIRLEQDQRVARPVTRSGDDPGLSAQRVRWLELAYERVREAKLSEAPPLGQVALAYSFPTKGAASGGKGAIDGQWIGSKLDGSPNGEQQLIVIHPKLWNDPAEVAGVLAHEMVHAATPGDGHGGKFPSLAKRIGLVGKPTQAGAGEEFRAWVDNEFATQKLPPFPAGAVSITRRRVQGTRQRLWECQCEPPVKLRCASDGLQARCELCGELFAMKAPKTPSRIDQGTGNLSPAPNDAGRVNR
jgi:hypothetical protein